MNVKDYGRIIDSDAVSVLLNSVEALKVTDNFYQNNWFYYGADPKNNIEKYILDTFDNYFPDLDSKKICGFEWWVHDEETIETVSLHFDCDEYKRLTEYKIVSPLASTITYLNDNLSPTIITNIETIGDMEYEPKYPSEIVYSFPGEGKFIIFDPKYLHGVMKGKSKRLTLLYNVWEYRPEDLIEVSMSENIHSCNIHHNQLKDLHHYFEETNFIPQNLFGNSVFLKFPVNHINYETYLLKT
jgi:hypothetical protein